MKIFNEHYPHIGVPFVLCIGKFDGLHIGHRLILDTLLDEARRRQALPVVYSFEPRGGTPLLTTREEKLQLFSSLGVGAVVLAEFTEELMATKAERFIENLLGCGQLLAVAVGRDFRFGRGAVGDVALLGELGRRHGFAVHAVEQVQVSGLSVSSTLIRERIKAGQVDRAALLLGREYALAGEVVPGRRLARSMGFHTANILPPEGKVVPAFGVYAAYVDVQGKLWPAIVNIGVKPTIGGTEMLIESHLLGFEGNLYGKKIAVNLVKRIRDEIKFAGVQQLAEQLETDRETVRSILGGREG